MIDIKDRVVEHPNRYRLNLVAGETDVYDLEGVPGLVTEVGTPVNKELLMSFYGFVAKTTVFNPDGSVTETNSDGYSKVTTFPSDTQVVETFTGEDSTLVKTTTFNVDGSISEVIS